MAARITWRSRPRIDAPMGLTLVEATAADCAAAARFGPLPLAALAELLLRVKVFTLSGTITPDGESPISATVAAPRVKLDTEEVADELDVNREIMHPVLEVWDRIAFKFVATEEVGNPGFSAGASVSYIDENGKYWMDFGLYLPVEDEWYFTGFGFESSAATATVVLASGTYDLPCAVPGGSAGTLTVTATEWFPYATSTGAAAWNTTTGAAANGGPGA